MRARLFVALCFALAAGAAMADVPADPRPACAPYSAASDPFEPDGDPALRLAELARREGDVADARLEPNCTGSVRCIAWGASILRRWWTRTWPRPAATSSWPRGAGRSRRWPAWPNSNWPPASPGEAMMWAQVYVKAMRVRDQGRGLGYPAHLLKRILLELPPSSKDEQERLLGEFMRAQGEKFRAHQAQAKDAQDAADCRRVEDDWPTRLVTDRAALVRPKGRPALPLQRHQRLRLVQPAGGSVRRDRQRARHRVGADGAHGAGPRRPAARNALQPGGRFGTGRQVLVPLSLDRGEVRLRD